MDVSEKAILSLLHSINGVGNKTLWKIKERFNTFGEFFRASTESIGSCLQNAETAERVIAARKHNNPLAFWENLQQSGIEVLTWEDESYPYLLRNISDPPFLFYYRGNLKIGQQVGFAVVGSRKATQYGRKIAREMGAALSRCKITVVSGMARGIDAEAHRGALEQNGPTLAILGSGIDIVYPRENEKLYKEITAKGLVISEFPPGTTPQPGNFPVRNRLISGISRGVIIIEARAKSGALITADFALQQGRDVFAVPGPINSKNSEGSNNLIKEGAKLITSVNDVLDEYYDLALLQSDVQPLKQLQLNFTEQRLMQCINEDKHHIDELVRRSGIDIQELSMILLKLEMEGIVKSLPGNYYVKI